jgi:hypothetical protein
MGMVVSRRAAQLCVATASVGTVGRRRTADAGIVNYMLLSSSSKSVSVLTDQTSQQGRAAAVAAAESAAQLHRCVANRSIHQLTGIAGESAGTVCVYTHGCTGPLRALEMMVKTA